MTFAAFVLFVVNGARLGYTAATFFQGETMVKRSVDRRDFLKGAAVTGAAALVPGAAASAAEAAQAAPPAQAPATAPTPPRETDPAGDVEVATIDRPGGDFMVDII